MVQRPGSLPAFEARFPDDEACARWLFGRRWPDGFRCPGCGHDKGWELGRERLTVQCAACERQVSVTVGTVLHRSHLPLKLWFLAAWLVATHENGISARQLWLQLGLGSYKTAWLLLRKLRRAMVDPEREPLAGLVRSEEHTSELQSPVHLVCRLLLEKKKKRKKDRLTKKNKKKQKKTKKSELKKSEIIKNIHTSKTQKQYQRCVAAHMQHTNTSNDNI